MINWNRVHELRNDVGADDFEEIVEIFLSEVTDLSADLQAAKTDQEMELQLHALKNASLNLGFSELSDLCQSAEVLARSGQAKSVDVRAIIGLLEASLQLFSAEAPKQLTK